MVARNKNQVKATTPKTTTSKTATSKTTQRKKPRIPKRETIEVKGARTHNFKDVFLEIPREELVVITGLSGSGKSSLAFDTIYAEGQRRYMESLSSYAKRFISQVAKPDVDFMFGLSPVISIEQKTVARNPRSTVGTLTEISSYLNLLLATIGQAQCPYCDTQIPVKTSAQLLDDLFSLGKGTTVELRAPVYPVYGENFDFLFTEIRKKGYRHMIIDGRPVDISEDIELDETRPHTLQVVIDKFTIRAGTDKEIANSIQNTLLVGDPYI
jgi:excinuclease ABC subunit A